MSGFNGSQGGMPQQMNQARQWGGITSPLQTLPQQGFGRPVSAGQGFAAPMPQANTQAFRGAPAGGLLGMAAPNHLQSPAQSTAQFMQSQQAQRPASPWLQLGSNMLADSGSQFPFEGGGA